MRFALLVILLGACSFSGAEGGPGQSDGGSDGSSDGGGSNMSDPDDKDGDGIKNDADNCLETANPLQEDGDTDGVGNVCDNCPVNANPKLDTMGLGMIQRDHDGDGRGDVCDLCPHIKADADTDVDLDGIGTACDPNDAVKNPPAEFNGFYEAPKATEWATAVGGGAFADWELAQTTDKRLWWKQKTFDLARHQLVRTTPADIKEAYVDTTFRVHQLRPRAGADVFRTAALSYGFLRVSGSDFNFNCGVRQDVQAVATTAFSAAFDDNNIRAGEVQETAWTGDFIERDIHVVGSSTEIDRGGGNKDTGMACSANAAPATAATLNNATSTLFPDGKVALRTYGLTASFDYIFIVDKSVAP